MAIKDLQARMGNVELQGTIVDKGAVREFQKFGKTGKVCNAKLKDETGTITLTLWNDDVDKVNLGDKIQIHNGWVSEYQGELQLGTGKFGELTILEKGAQKPEERSQQSLSPPEEEEGDTVLDDSDEEEVVENNGKK